MTKVNTIHNLISLILVLVGVIILSGEQRGW